MPRKGDNIYKRKDGRWEGRYVKGRKNGCTLFGSVFGKSYKETRIKLAKARCDWKQGLATTTKGRTKLKAISKRWIKESEAFLKESTIAIYRNYLQKHIYPVFANTCLSDISNEALSDFCISLLKNEDTDRQGLSSKTVTEVLRIMKQIRKFAMLRNMEYGSASLPEFAWESHAPSLGTTFRSRKGNFMCVTQCNVFVTKVTMAQKPRLSLHHPKVRVLSVRFP